MKPMLMNSEMVKAILAGRKTVTRRLIKPQPKDKLEFIVAGDTKYIGKWFDRKNGGYWIPPCCCGDVLYVRETFYKDSKRYIYKADYLDNEVFYQNGQEIIIKWQPSIHMPKEAARIFLRVTGVRVERLQDITTDDIWYKEGIPFGLCIAPYDGFARLWNSTVKKADIDKYGWDANPWVFVIEFERISKEEAMKNEGDIIPWQAN